MLVSTERYNVAKNEPSWIKEEIAKVANMCGFDEELREDGSNRLVLGFRKDAADVRQVERRAICRGGELKFKVESYYVGTRRIAVHVVIDVLRISGSWSHTHPLREVLRQMTASIDGESEAFSAVGTSAGMPRYVAHLTLATPKSKRLTLR